MNANGDLTVDLRSDIAAESRASATTIQTVGTKGYDGFTMVLVGAGYRR